MSADALFAPEEPGCETLRVPVIKVFDGDGFKTHLWHPSYRSTREMVVRFGFTDAPEMQQPGGKQARDFLCSLIDERWIDLVVLTKSDTGRITDRFGRVVCKPYLSDGCGGMRNIELEMILNGWTWVLERYGPPHNYMGALADAQRHRRGIWASANNIQPWTFKRKMYQSKAKVIERKQACLF